MSTATASTESLQQIGELHQRAEELTSKYHEEFGEIMQEISAIASGGEVTAAPAAPKTATAPKPKRGGSSSTTATAPKPPSRKRASTPSSSNGKKTATTRNYDNDMSLQEAVFDVLDREDWDGILDKENGVVTLSAGEIKKVIETEGKWVSSASDITSQLQGALKGLRKKGLVVWENKEYYVPEGAEYTK